MCTFHPLPDTDIPVNAQKASLHLSDPKYPWSHVFSNYSRSLVDVHTQSICFLTRITLKEKHMHACAASHRSISQLHASIYNMLTCRHSTSHMDTHDLRLITCMHSNAQSMHITCWAHLLIKQHTLNLYCFVLLSCFHVHFSLKVSHAVFKNSSTVVLKNQWWAAFPWQLEKKTGKCTWLVHHLTEGRRLVSHPVEDQGTPWRSLYCRKRQRRQGKAGYPANLETPPLSLSKCKIWEEITRLNLRACQVTWIGSSY